MSGFQPLFAFTADLHLQPNAWAKHPSLQGDSYESLRQIVDFCIDNNLPLLLGGDIFDSKRPDPFSVRFFGQQMHRMAMSRIQVTFIQGDHDYHPTAPWPTVSGVCFHSHGTSQTLGGYNIYALDWTPRDQLPGALANIPDNTDFLLCHQAWEELQGIGQVEGSIADIPYAANILTGDYHVALDKEVRANDSRTVKVYSAGSTCMQSIDERYVKSFLVVGIEDGNFAFRREPLLTRMKFEVVYNENAELEHDLTHGVFDEMANDQRIHQLPQVIQKPILRVNFSDEIPDALERIKQGAADRFHIFPYPHGAVEDIAVDIDDAPEGAFSTLLDACRRLATDEATYTLTTSILRSREVEEELERMFDEFSSGYGPASPSPGTGEDGSTVEPVCEGDNERAEAAGHGDPALDRESGPTP